MKNIDLRKTVNLHKYNLNLQNLISQWKIIIPLILSLAGIFIGTFIIKGESTLYNRFGVFIEANILNNSHETFHVNMIIYLLVPTFFAVIMFFMGLSVYGGLIATMVPFVFGLMSGVITYYMYSEYTLKGLAYCVIMIFPYITLSLFSLILITGECITMSQYLLCELSSKHRKAPDYSITKYYINTLKSYVIIIIAAIIKTGIEMLFIGLFSF